MFSGHNGGDTRGFYYVQGAYLQKGFNKHGPLSNPYAFGYFPALKHDRVPRFTHELVIYAGGSLPEKYAGRMFAVAPLLNYVSISELKPRGSTFETKDLDFITSSDRWFRPVDIAVGPDGSLYIADWCDKQTSHLRNSEGEIDKQTGRVYRLQTKEVKQPQRGDLSKKTTAELLTFLQDNNIWVRQTVLRLLGDRRDPAAVAPLRKMLAEESGQAAWNHCGLWISPAASIPPPRSRRLIMRIPCAPVDGAALGRRTPSRESHRRQIRGMARSEPNIEVCAQLACTAKRLPTVAALNIVRGLVRHADLEDPQLPLLLWWAIEAHCGTSPEAVLGLCADPEFSSQPLTRTQLLCARHAALREHRQAGGPLGVRQALGTSGSRGGDNWSTGSRPRTAGARPTSLPQELVVALGKTGKAGLALRVRLDEPAALDEALAALANKATKPELSEELIAVLGEVRAARAIPLLLDLAAADKQPKLQPRRARRARELPRRAHSCRLAQSVCGLPARGATARPDLLTSRASSALALLAAIEAGRIPANSLPMPIVKKLALHRDPKIDAAVERLWGKSITEAAALVKIERERLTNVPRDRPRFSLRRKKLFTASCAKCHTLFSQGGQIGPDLTAYNREQLDNMLRHIVDPNAEIREGFETFAVTTHDGRALTGFLADQDAQ